MRIPPHHVPPLLYPSPPSTPRPDCGCSGRSGCSTAEAALLCRTRRQRGGSVGVGAPSRKRAGHAGAAADKCMMSFKVSVAGSGCQCRGGRQTSGGGTGTQRPAEPPRGARRVGWTPPGCPLGTGGWLLWFVVWLYALC